MQKLTRREAIKLASAAGLAALLGALSGGIDPEEKVEELEQPTEEPTEQLTTVYVTDGNYTRTAWLSKEPQSKRWFIIDKKTGEHIEISGEHEYIMWRHVGVHHD